jgi:hypothetical protein
MTYFIYRQNNSGGSFDLPAVKVAIKADSPADADAIALENGIYFDPEFEIDCDCCGNRWSEASEYDKFDEVPPATEWEEMFAKYDEVPALVVIG